MTLIMSVLMTPLAISIGVLFDLVGRKKPMIFAYILATIGEVWYPFVTN